MLKSLKIENFRCFSTFELQQLGRINLLVGTNNSGKTSILEAIQLFYKRDSLEGLSEIMISRGEYLWSDEEQKTRELDLRHLFYGHQIDLGSSFSISGEYDDFQENLSIVIEQDQQLQLFDYLKDFVLLIKWLGKEKGNLEFPLSANDPKIERIAALGSDKNSFRSNRGFVIRLSDSDQRIPIGSMGDGICRSNNVLLVEGKEDVRVIPELIEANGIAWGTKKNPVVYLKSFSCMLLKPFLTQFLSKSH